ncbi:MAG TPA: glycerol-3-phosphate dehydrogenase/oxidase [Ilumatobacteraceae bacterium]|nr:glycerol-3-phosphate dehydrogenase/oxidase [Ilumatobacteraceae bacterium]
MSGPARRFERTAMIDALRDSHAEPFDVLVIGGGITGVGVALDAAARGLRTALVERDDFASGTSSKSSKMVHGGLRYLQQGDVRLVYQALRERRRLMRNAPHLVEVLPFMIPILTRDGVVSKKIAKALGSAMWMYDLTGGWRIGKLHRKLSAEEAARHFPTTHVERLSAGYLYYDAGADDARLTLTIARTAADHGAVVVNRCGVVAVTSDADGRADGAVVEADGERIEVRARCIVNAAGVWADEVRALDEGRDPASIRPAKGVHVTIPWEKVRNDIAVIIPVRSDRRSLFLVPWDEQPDGTFRHVYVGTTDTDSGEPIDDPQCTGDDIDYVLTALSEALTETVTRDDITGVWAGMRPLVRAATADEGNARTADLSRRHQVAVSDSGVVRVNGGKLTTYREMAADTVDTVVRQLGSPWRARRSPTARLRLAGAGRPTSARGTLDAHLARRFGTDADQVRALIAFEPSLAEPLVPGQPYLRAEAIHAARHEMITTLDDVLVRRTRAHLFDRAATEAAAPAVAALIAPELGWDAAEVERQLDRYRAICRAEETAAGHHIVPEHPTAGAAHGQLTNAPD